MIHVALRSRSVNAPDRPFTTPGLGDRIHQSLIGWAYGRGNPVTLHLTQDKAAGGRYGNKLDSWNEVLGLFPAGSLSIAVHRVANLPEREWIAYLRSKGIDPVTWWYGDHPGRYEPVEPVDIAPCLRDFTRLTAAPQVMALPERFYVAQWDATGAVRSVKGSERPKYDLPCVIVGGEASGDLRWSIKHIAWAISRAEFYAGADSAFFHLAQLYLPMERIHLYHRGTVSHHVRRARDNGARCVHL